MLKNNPTINIILTIPQTGWREGREESRMNSIVHRNKKPSPGPSASLSAMVWTWRAVQVLCLSQNVRNEIIIIITITRARLKNAFGQRWSNYR